VSDTVGVEPSQELRIELGSAVDSPAAASLCASAMGESWSASAIRSELEQEGASLWLARASGAMPIGMLLSRCVLDVVSIHLIAVEVSARRRGIARELFDRMRSTQGDAHRIDLEVRASNDPAIALYRALGFEVVGRRPRYYRGAEDAVLMALDLDAGAGR